MNYYVYALKSLKDGRIYIGISENIVKRLEQHNGGKTKSTKGYAPWKIIFTRKANDRKHARELEKYYKSGSGKEKLKKLVP